MYVTEEFFTLNNCLPKGMIYKLDKNYKLCIETYNICEHNYHVTTVQITATGTPVIIT